MKNCFALFVCSKRRIMHLLGVKFKQLCDRGRKRSIADETWGSQCRARCAESFERGRQGEHELTRKIVMEWLVLLLSPPRRENRDPGSFALAIISWGEILGSCAIEQDNGDNLRRGFAQKIAHPRAAPINSHVVQRTSGGAAKESTWETISVIRHGYRTQKWLLNNTERSIIH